MPCNDGGWPGDATSDALERERKTKKRLDSVTALLCGLMHKLEKYQPAIAADAQDKVPGLKDWWIEHQEHDRQRKAAELKDKKRRMRVARQAVAEAKQALEQAEANLQKLDAKNIKARIKG